MRIIFFKKINYKLFRSFKGCRMVSNAEYFESYFPNLYKLKKTYKHLTLLLLFDVTFLFICCCFKVAYIQTDRHSRRPISNMLGLKYYQFSPLVVFRFTVKLLLGVNLRHSQHFATSQLVFRKMTCE